MRNMIKNNTFKAGLLVITFIGAISCNNLRKPEDPKDVAEERNEAKFENTSKEDDSEFLVNAAEIDLEEIQLAQLAQEKGTRSDVKELGIMMEKQHSKSLTELLELAAKKIISVPTSLTDDAKKAYDKMNKKSGKEFDEAYCDMMVSEHKDAISVFEKASKESADYEIKEWASTSLAVLRSHLDHAMACKNKTENLK